MGENDTNFNSYTQNTIAPVASSLLHHFLQKLHLLLLLLLPPATSKLHHHYSIKKNLYSSASYRHYSIFLSSNSNSSYLPFQSSAFYFLLPRFLQLAKKNKFKLCFPNQR